ncbi:hypothetical protein [Paenarthrobacter sp. NPDC057981]|uniref:alpha/beta hydrolase n=1 Tax=Paenarthrobacter sp. NPDC057981 TaxID=3346297 RepID=UPI0036D81E97
MQTPWNRPPDRSHIITAGHSLGGAAALKTARLDDRVDAAVGIDGMPRTPENAAPVTKPALAIVAGDADPNPEYNAVLDALLDDGNGVRVTLDGVTHFGMIDVALMIGPVPGNTGMRGPSGPSSAAQATLHLIDAVTTGRSLTPALAQLGTVSAPESQ